MVSLPVFECSSHEKLLGVNLYLWEDGAWKVNSNTLTRYSLNGLSGKDYFDRASAAMAEGNWFAATPYALVASQLTQLPKGLKFDYDQGLQELTSQLKDQHFKFFPREVKVGPESVSLAALFLSVPVKVPSRPDAAYKPIPQIVFYCESYVRNRDPKKLCQTVEALHKECQNLFPKGFESFEMVNYKPSRYPTMDEKTLLSPGDDSLNLDTKTGKVI